MRKKDLKLGIKQWVAHSELEGNVVPLRQRNLIESRLLSPFVVRGALIVTFYLIAAQAEG